MPRALHQGLWTQQAEGKCSPAEQAALGQGQVQNHLLGWGISYLMRKMPARASHATWNVEWGRGDTPALEDSRLPGPLGLKKALFHLEVGR